MYWYLALRSGWLAFYGTIWKLPWHVCMKSPLSWPFSICKISVSSFSVFWDPVSQGSSTRCLDILWGTCHGEVHSSCGLRCGSTTCSIPVGSLGAKTVREGSLIFFDLGPVGLVSYLIYKLCEAASWWCRPVIQGCVGCVVRRRAICDTTVLLFGTIYYLVVSLLMSVKQFFLNNWNVL